MRCWSPTGETLVSKAPFPLPSSSALPSPDSISVVKKDRWLRAGLAGSSPSPLSYFHKPIIADHLGRLRPRLSPIQLGRWGGELGGPWLLDRATATCAITRLPWERAAGAKPRSLGEGCGGVGGAGGGHRCTHLHPERGQGAGPRRACSLRSRAPGG